MDQQKKNRGIWGFFDKNSETEVEVSKTKAQDI